MRSALPAPLVLSLLAGCGSSKRAAPRYDRAKVTRCLRAGGDSFASAGGGVIRLNLSGESRFGTLAEIDVAFGRDGKDALGRLRAGYFFRKIPGFSFKPPRLPAGAMTFCSRTTLEMSEAVTPSRAMRSGSSQIRML